MRIWTVDDVMTREVVTVPPTARYRELVDLVTGHHFSAVPVVDEARRVVGVVSEADLLCKVEFAGDERHRLFESRHVRGERTRALGATAAELMSAPPIVVTAGTAVAAAARTMDDERVKRLPVVDEANRLVGIVTRSDLLKIHLRTDGEIRTDVVDGVLKAVFPDEAESIDVEVTGGVTTLSGRVMRRSVADLMVILSQQVAGVVRVADRVAFEYDDRPDVVVPRRHDIV
jgi:CBS domain-containing protein